MKVLTIVPARGGSKRLPGKNIVDLGGKPLIAWTIQAAMKSSFVDHVLVSTDDNDIATISKYWGAEVPFLRPDHLASDDSPTIDVVMQILNSTEGYDWILLLQPSSPLRQSQDIDGIIEFAIESGCNSAVSICAIGKRTEWIFGKTSTDTIVPLSNSTIPASLDQNELFALNGALFLAKIDWLYKYKSFVTDETLGFVMPTERSVDIDTKLDLEWAKFLLEISR